MLPKGAPPAVTALLNEQREWGYSGYSSLSRRQEHNLNLFISQLEGGNTLATLYSTAGILAALVTWTRAHWLQHLSEGFFFFFGLWCSTQPVCVSRCSSCCPKWSKCASINAAVRNKSQKRVGVLSCVHTSEYIAPSSIFFYCLVNIGYLPLCHLLHSGELSF